MRHMNVGDNLEPCNTVLAFFHPHPASCISEQGLYAEVRVVHAAGDTRLAPTPQETISHGFTFGRGSQKTDPPHPHCDLNDGL